MTEGFEDLDGFVKDITKDLHQKVKDQKKQIETLGDEYGKNAYFMFDFEPIDTGQSQTETKTELFDVNGTDEFELSIFVDSIDPNTGIFYAVFFLYGLGSNAAYGPRPTHQVAMKSLLNDFEQFLE